MGKVLRIMHIALHPAQHIDVTRHRAKYSYVCVPSIIVFISP